MMIWILLLLLPVPQEAADLRKKADYKEIVERNVFSQPRPKKAPEKKQEPKKEKPAPKPKSWIVTSVYFAQKEKAFKAIAEKEGDLRILKIGDEMDGVTVERIEFGVLTVRLGEETIRIKLGDRWPLKADDRKEAFEAKKEEKESKEPVEKDDKGTQDVLQRLKERFKKKPLPEPPEDER